MRILVELEGSAEDLALYGETQYTRYGLRVKEVIYGWWCAVEGCGVFNGLLKEDLRTCRCWGRERGATK